MFLKDDCIKENIGKFEVSVSFRDSKTRIGNFGYLRVFDDETDEDVTTQIFGDKGRVVATIERLNQAKLWCEMKQGMLVVDYS